MCSWGSPPTRVRKLRLRHVSLEAGMSLFFGFNGIVVQLTGFVSGSWLCADESMPDGVTGHVASWVLDTHTPLTRASLGFSL